MDKASVRDAVFLIKAPLVGAFSFSPDPLAAGAEHREIHEARASLPSKLLG
ncbi:hypothetical protein [Variovorax soli]|uniref:Uncharacterized protein n=1 Tax=Variovorax soli TaxID=376815 RepID=A0ABU1N738_9BURK|nr:hypothetical protein [Variovorax soli]MDR6534263.1 hypothetical protein [Variovorax soli]